MLFMKRRSRFQRANEVRGWLTHDERGRVVGLVLVSVAMSIAMTLLAAAIVGAISRRRAQGRDDEAPGAELPADAEPGTDDAAGIAVMDGTALVDHEVAAQA